jgi:hypothetical protein
MTDVEWRITSFFSLFPVHMFSLSNSSEASSRFRGPAGHLPPVLADAPLQTIRPGTPIFTDRSLPIKLSTTRHVYHVFDQDAGTHWAFGHTTYGKPGTSCPNFR